MTATDTLQPEQVSPFKRRRRVARDFKQSTALEGDDCCEVCRWRPPRALRDVAGGRIDTLLQAHHVVPIACGGLDAPENLVLLCPTHHAIAHYIGRMGPRRGGGIREWRGPRSPRELRVAFELTTMRDEYSIYALFEGDLNGYIERCHREALEFNEELIFKARREFTVIRGTKT